MYLIKHKNKYGELYIKKQKEISRIHYLKNKEKFKEKYLSIRDTNEYKEKKNYERKRYFEKWKNEIYKLLGDKCIKCGFSDKRALQIDHINGDGYLDKNKRTLTYYKLVFLSIKNGEKRYQMLCANCNWIKRVEMKEHYRGINDRKICLPN